MLRKAEVFTLSGEGVHFDRNMHLDILTDLFLKMPTFTAVTIHSHYNDDWLILSDSSFETASQKMEEHYGFTVPVSSVQAITLSHARRMNE